MGAYQIGELIGAVIGLVLLGSGLAWVYRRLLRAEWTISVGLALLTLALVAGVTNSDPSRPYLATVLVYLVAAIPAFFIMNAVRPRNLALQGHSKAEPSFSPDPVEQTETPPEIEDREPLTNRTQGGVLPTNWRRGFFRLWVVLALLWCALVALILSGQILSPYVPSKAVATRTGEVSAALYETYGEPYNSWAAASRSGSIVATEVRPGFQLFTSLEVTGPILVARVEEARALVDAYRDRTIAERRTGALGTLLAAAVAPPLLVLALGWLLAWALAGFFAPYRR